MKEISRMDFSFPFFKKRKTSGVDLSRTGYEDAGVCDTVWKIHGRKSQTIQDWIFLKIEINEKTEHILLVVLKKMEVRATSYVIGRMAACQIRNLYLSAQEPVNETNFLRRMLHGDYSERQIREENQEVRLKSGWRFCYM